MYYDHTIHMSQLGLSGTLLDPPNAQVSNPHATALYILRGISFDFESFRLLRNFCLEISSLLQAADAPTVSSSGRGDQLHRVAQSVELSEAHAGDGQATYAATGKALTLRLAQSNPPCAGTGISICIYCFEFYAVSGPSPIVSVCP